MNGEGYIFCARGNKFRNWLKLLLRISSLRIPSSSTEFSWLNFLTGPVEFRNKLGRKLIFPFRIFGCFCSVVSANSRGNERYKFGQKRKFVCNWTKKERFSIKNLLSHFWLILKKGAYEKPLNIGCALRAFRLGIKKRNWHIEIEQLQMKNSLYQSKDFPLISRYFSQTT